MKPPRILVIGSANADLVTRVSRCPKPGESLVGSSFQTVPGGKGANQAVAAARLGATTRFVGCVGNDALGGMLRESLNSAGVDTTHLRTHPTEPTGTAVILVGDDGQNSIVVTPSANYGITPNDVRSLRSVFQDSDVVLLQLEIPLETVEAALDMAREAGALSILDAGPAQKVAPELLCKADVVSPNETEAEAMTGIEVTTMESARRAAQCLRSLGAREVVMKLGAMGSLYVGESELAVLAFPVPPIDTTAAGDAFTAALATMWLSETKDAGLRFANAVGALACTAAGAQPSMPTRTAVDAFLSGKGGTI